MINERKKMSSLSSDLGSSSSSLNNNSGNSANAADASCAGGNSPAVLVGSPSSLASGAIHNSSALILAEGWVSALSPETGHWDRNYCIIATANAAAAASDKAAASATPVSLLLFDNALAVATAPPQSSLAINKASVADYTDGSFDRASVFAVNGSVLATTAPEEKAAYLKLLAQGGANVATSHINKNTANANSSSSSKAANLTLPSSSNAAAAGAAGGSATALTVTVPATPANGAAATGTGAGDGNGVGTVSTAVTGAAAVKTPTTGRSGTSRRLASANAPVVDIDALEKTDGLGVIAFAAPIWVCDPASSSKPAKLRYGVIRDWGLELYTVDAVDEFRRHARLAGPTSAHAELEALTRYAKRLT